MGCSTYCAKIFNLWAFIRVWAPRGSAQLFVMGAMWLLSLFYLLMAIFVSNAWLCSLANIAFYFVIVMLIQVQLLSGAASTKA